MDNLFKEHKLMNKEDFAKMWENCLFVFDTNVLLNLYRLPITAQKDVFDILLNQKINSRVWLPFQVALEYTNNRLDVISDQKNKFNSVRGIINEGVDNANNLYATLIDKLDKLQLKKRHSAINPDDHLSKELINDVVNKLNLFLTELDKLDKQQPDVTDKDKIKERISQVFHDKIGNSLSEKELEVIFNEGSERYKEQIPPGYKDDTKPGFYLHKGIKYVRKYGDLVFWKEILKKSKEDAVEYVVLISDDNKEDWWQVKRGKRIGPRYELLDEIYHNSQTLKAFYMYDTSGFMKFSKEYLKIEVNEQSIIETKDILEVNHRVDQITTIENGITSIKDLINELGQEVSVKIIFPQDYLYIPFILLPYKQIRMILLEILSNVFNHSLDKVVYVRIQNSKDHLIVKFKNAIKTKITSETKNIHRGKGHEFIKSFLSNSNIGHLELSTNRDKFQTKLYIKNEYTL